MSTDLGSKKEDLEVDGEGVLNEDLPNENSSSKPTDGVGKGQRYSFGMKSDLGPLVIDPSSLKTISLVDVCPVVNPTSSAPITSKGAKRKPTQKAEEDASRKTQHRKNDNKKAELALNETTVETNRVRITRSSAKTTN